MMARKFREIVIGIERDLGGDMIEAQKQLLARAATLATLSEECESDLANGRDFDPMQYAKRSYAKRQTQPDTAP